MPYGLAVAIIGKREGKTKNVTHAVWSGLVCQRAKILGKNKICHARHMVWQWPSSAKKVKTENVMHAVWSGLDFCQNLMG
jgi:hypothetical protein